MCSMALVTAAVATVLLRKTDVGVLLRALAERPTTAELLGVPSRMLTIGVWMATGLVAAVAVALVAPTQTHDQYSLSMLVVPSAAAALHGAFRPVWLAVVGGIGLGLLPGATAPLHDLPVVTFLLPFVAILVLPLWGE